MQFQITLMSAALGEWRTRIEAVDERDALDRYLERMGERGVTRESATSARFLDEVHVRVEPVRLRVVPVPPVEDGPRPERPGNALAAIKRQKAGWR